MAGKGLPDRVQVGYVGLYRPDAFDLAAVERRNLVSALRLKPLP